VKNGDVLAHFHEALGDLKAHALQDHVRILFFGDSHAQGEAWTGSLRRDFAKRFGDGGPGFVYAGLRAHRNDATSCTFDGDWIQKPKAPSSPARDADGIFGLGGVLSAADHGVARVTISPRSAAGMRWDVCLRLATTHGDAVVSARGAPPSTLAGPLSAPLVHRTFASVPPGDIDIDLSGDAELCGVVGERDPKDGAGVVLDTLGINGARIGTALSWDAASFRAELSRRKPDLVILEYGTNESAEKELRPDSYAANERALIERVQAASPDASCLVIGPTELEAHPEAVRITSPALQTAAEQKGCAFWDPYRAMGGEGAMKKWRTQSPPLAQSDGIHLTEAGYAELAKQLFADLTAGI
jgi:lysophospholipase L1-like esterase